MRRAVLGLTAAGLAGALVLRGEPLPLDRWSLEALAGQRGPVGTAVAGAVALLGSGMLLYPLLAALVFVRGTRAVLAVALLAAAQLGHDVLLAGVPLERPDPGLRLAAASGAATASGHAMTAVVGWGLLLTVLGVPRRWVYATAGLAGVLVGAARAYLAVHWLSDVVAGLLLGLAALTVARWVLDRPWPALRRPAWDWKWLLTAGAAVFALAPIVWTAPDQRMKDLLVYAGSAAAAGSGTDVYAYRTPFGMPFTYPPFAAILVEPLSRVPLGLLQVLWALGTVALLIPLAQVALEPVVRRVGLPVAVALLLISSPVRSHLRFGQVGVLLVLLVALDLLRPGISRRWQGWGVGLAAAVKLTPAVYVPWMFVTAPLRRRGLSTVLWAGGATLVGLLLLWPSSPSYLLRAAWDTDRFGDNAWPGNQSVRGALLRAGLSPLWLACALILVVLATWGARRLELRGDRLGAVGVLAALAVAVSPISWVHHLVWLALPIAALVHSGRTRLAAVWYALLVVSLPSIGSSLDARWPVLHPLWALIVDAQGLTAVAAVVLLPFLLRSPPAAGVPVQRADAPPASGTPCGVDAPRAPA